MANFNIKERRIGNVAVLDMDGQLRTAGSGAALTDTIGRLLDEGRNQILLNLSGVASTDANGLGDLLASHNTVNKKGGQIKFLHLTRRVRELMMNTRLLTVFDIYENESAALDSFKSPASGLAEPTHDALEDTLQ
ncbi:MAG TPA: STAS domain-containing protein [Pyrinomonadaceae bacterium]|nr:STAS domain-containing protein [Pyrinomonadaceae bacterium]